MRQVVKAEMRVCVVKSPGVALNESYGDIMIVKDFSVPFPIGQIECSGPAFPASVLVARKTSRPRDGSYGALPRNKLVRAFHRVQTKPSFTGQQLRPFHLLPDPLPVPLRRDAFSRT